jgi:uncharacterized protein YyaL (SSP411 family)
LPNALANATSAYLLAHAEQPVDWHPWGPEAFALASATGKPILLSIGYQACHWCHVMAHESFADEATAQLMNQGFVNIKVDREELPEVDQLYQTAHAILRRQGGGWPLTIFLSPQGVPFYSGTYFPREAQPNLPALRDILTTVSTVWQDQREALARQDQALLERLQADSARAQEGVAISAKTAQDAVQQLSVAFDTAHGGFGAAPKFPHPTDLAFLLDRGRQGDDTAQHLALFTLRKMAEGGLFDQIGGGFYRYSTDARWDVPHFEKMLCDNALLLTLYAQAYAMTDEPLFARTADLIVAWLVREMKHPDGGFRASQSADDGKGQEGGAYTWDREVLRQALTPMEWDVCSAHWGLIDPANVAGRWHLRVARPLSDMARLLERPEKMLQDLVDGARAKLLTAREARELAAPDPLAPTRSNALMVSALAQAGHLCQQTEWVQLARDTLSHLQASRWTAGGELLSLPHLPQTGGLEDHAFLLEAVLALHAVAPQADDVTFAHVLANTLISRFEDSEDGGFYATAHDAAALFFRLKPGLDAAMPSGNGSAAWAMITLNRVAPQPSYLLAASRCVKAFARTVIADPASHTRLLQAALSLGG